MKTQQTRSTAAVTKGSKFPKVTNKYTERNSGYNFSSSLGNKNNVNLESKTHFQLIPLTKADNITINLSTSPTKINESKITNENVNIPKIVHEKSDSLQLVSNTQSFTCVLSALITTSEVNINVNFKLHGSDVSEKPILSLYCDFNSTAYNILATAFGQQLHIQQQHLQSGNATNVKFLCPTGALALEWTEFINTPHKLTVDMSEVVTTTGAFPSSPKYISSPRSPVRFTPVSQFNSTTAVESEPYSGKPLLSPILQSTSPILEVSEHALIATPPPGLLSMNQMGSPRRRSQSSQEASRTVKVVIPVISSSEGNLTPAHHPVITRQHDLLKASLRPLPTYNHEAVNRSRHSLSEDVITSSQFRMLHREHSLSADVATDQFGSLTQANLQRMNIIESQVTFSGETRTSSSRPPNLVEQWNDEINKIRTEIENTEQQYRQEEAGICAVEEASLKDSVNTVYNSLLHQGLLPSELEAEQAKVQVWESVQRKKNSRKSIQRLSIIAEELGSMRREGEELIRKLRADIEREEARQAEQLQHSNDQCSKIVEENTAAIAANKLRVQEESDRLRAEMSAAERRIKDEALHRNQEEEAKLQQTVSSVYASLLNNQELSSTELLLEQDKVHVWENIQRAKLAKSVKARRKATSKEVSRVLDLGREAIKQLMVDAEDHKQRLLLEIQQAESRQQTSGQPVGEEQSMDDVVKFRTYSDMPTVDGRQLPTHISSAASATSTVNSVTVTTQQQGTQNEATTVVTVEHQREVRQREELIERLKGAILSIQNDTAVQEQRLAQEESALCMEETAGLTASVGAVYSSLLQQGLTADQLLNEQEKVAVWETIQRRKQLKQAMRRKAALKTRLCEVREACDDQVRALTLELENALYGLHNTSDMALSALDSLSMTPLVDGDTNSPLERRMKDYSRAQFELHSAAQKELYDKQQAVQQQIAEHKAAILLEEKQRLEALQAEVDRKERVELERLEAVRLLAEQQKEEEERNHMHAIDEEDQHRTRVERAVLQEMLRLHEAKVAGLARKVCHRMATRIQVGFRRYKSRVFLHAQATHIQRHVRGHLVTRRIARHFCSAIAQIEDQSARVITSALRAYVTLRKAKFLGWAILHELVVASVLRFALQRREILLISRRIAVNRRKKDALALSRQQRADRKEKEKTARQITPADVYT